MTRSPKPRAMARRTLLALPPALAATGAGAQSWPTRPVRLVVPFSPAGGTDNLARLIAPRLSEKLAGQSVVIENRPGASGNIGCVTVAQSNDGHSLLVHGNGIVVTDLLYRNPGFDWRRDFVHVASMASTPVVLVIHPSVPARNLTEFIAYARANPGKLNHGTPGSGTAPFLAAALFDDMAGTRIVHVPYRGTGPAVAGLLTGELQVMFVSVSAVEAFIRDGRMRAIGTTAARRSAALPDVPAIAEAVPGYSAELWYTISAPARTPEAVIATLEGALREVSQEEPFRRGLVERGFEPSFLDSRTLTAAMVAEADLWRAALPRMGITPE